MPQPKTHNCPTRCKKVRENIEKLCLTKSENNRIMKYLKTHGEYQYLKPHWKSLYDLNSAVVMEGSIYG